MDGDGGAPAKRAKLSAAAARRALVTAPGRRRRGRLTDLCDDLLLRILLYLPISQAGRTSVLSRRWRGIWAHAAADIRTLGVSSSQVPAPESTDWLRLAAPLVSGILIFHNSDGVSCDDLDRELARPEEAMVDRGAFELRCFKKATNIWLNLGFLSLALPPAGVFGALRILHLKNFGFQGQFSLSDTMCPSLQDLTISGTRGLVGLALSSNSLLSVELSMLRVCQRFNIVAPRLKLLDVTACFGDVPRPTVSIAAESLEVLVWEASYDPESVCFGEMPRLSVLRAPPISTFVWQGSQTYQSCARFLNRFPAVNHLELGMSLDVPHNCPPICQCDHEPASWRVEAMRALEEVNIWNFNWVEREVDSEATIEKGADAQKCENNLKKYVFSFTSGGRH